MDCKYILNNEIYEKYLFGTLTAEDKNAYEQHLSECATCKQELEKQKFLISGVRSVSRAEMKNEIREQVKNIKSQNQSADWQMILKVAAVMFIIALIPSVIYYFQTDTGAPLTPFAAEEQIVSDEDESLAAEQSTRQEQSMGKSGKAKESKELAVESEQQQKQPMPAIPLTKPDVESMAMGKAGMPAETASIAAVIEDSIAESNLPDTLLAESQPSKLAGYLDTTQIFQDIAEGTEYYFAQINEKKSRFDTRETEELQMLDEVATQQFAPNTGRQAGEMRPEETSVKSSAVYEAEDKKITVHFHLAGQVFRKDRDSGLPQTFDVQMLNRDSLNWEMIWHVNPGFLEYDPSQIEIVKKDQIMYLILLKKYIYSINLNSDSIKAILLNK